MDFISGCIYAINGKYHQISKYVFIFTPEQVDISGDTLDQVKEQSDTMPTINRELDVYKRQFPIRSKMVLLLILEICRH